MRKLLGWLRLGLPGLMVWQWHFWVRAATVKPMDRPKYWLLPWPLLFYRLKLSVLFTRCRLFLLLCFLFMVAALAAGYAQSAYKEFGFRRVWLKQTLNSEGWEFPCPLNLIGSLPESSTRGLLVGKLLVGGLAVSWRIVSARGAPASSVPASPSYTISWSNQMEHYSCVHVTPSCLVYNNRQLYIIKYCHDSFSASFSDLLATF